MFLFAEGVVSVDEQHTIARGNTKQRDKADYGRNADFSCGKYQREYTSDKCKRKVEQDYSAFEGVSELHVEQQEYYDDAEQ